MAPAEDAVEQQVEWATPIPVDERSRWRRISPRKWATFGVVAFVVCVIGWTGFKAWQLDRAISRAEVDVAYLRTDLASGHFVAFAPDTARLRGDATAASSASHDPVWVLVGHIPFAGRNLRAASVVAQSLSRIVNGALVPLSTSHTFTIAASSNAGVSNLLNALGEDKGSIAAAVIAVDKANADVAALHTGGLLGFVQRRVVSAQAKLTRASTQVKDLSALSTVAPALLGQDRPRTILLMFQTPAEERGTGGLIGAWGELRTDKGAISLLGFGSLDSLAKVPVPPAGVSRDVPADYGSDISLPQNFNLSASFPDAAQIFSASWTNGPGQGVIPDAVVSIDPVALGHMLSAIGPVKTSNGTELNATNASDILQKKEYYTFPGAGPGAADRVPRRGHSGGVCPDDEARLRGWGPRPKDRPECGDRRPGGLECGPDGGGQVGRDGRRRQPRLSDGTRRSEHGTAGAEQPRRLETRRLPDHDLHVDERLQPRAAAHDYAA